MEITSNHLKRRPDCGTVLKLRSFKLSHSKHNVDGLPLVDKVTSEILSRLPAKSLMRFKCVCKPWCMLVEKDPYFTDLHCTQSKARPNFLAVILEPANETIGSQAERCGFSRSAYLVTADYLYEQEHKIVADIHGISKIKVPYQAKFFGPLNGLLGFFDYKNHYGVRLVNVCTQEITPWLKSDFDRKYDEQNNVSGSTHCHLGYDPITEVHKVIFRRCFARNVAICQVFTVGGDEWRRITDIPSILMDDYLYSVYVNGSIYFLSYIFLSGGSYRDKIVVFDVGPEKFRSITIPTFIIDHPRESWGFISQAADLLEVDGQLALLCRINCSMVKLWLYDDVEDEYKRKNYWKEVTIELPFKWNAKIYLTFSSVMGENKIMLKSKRCRFRKVDTIRKPSYCIYDLTKKTFTKMEIKGVPYSFFSASIRDKFFKESLWPVQ